VRCLARARRTSLTLLVLALALGAGSASAAPPPPAATPAAPPLPRPATSTAPAAPAPPSSPAPVDGPDRSGDPFARLGGVPDCAGLSGQELRNCRTTGSPAHAYPLDDYGFDIHIGGGVTDPGGVFYHAVQDLLNYLWLGLLFLLEGVVALLGWAFRLNLLDQGMGALTGALDRGTHALTEPWFTAALGALGLWAIWRGMVVRDGAQAAGGIGLSVLLMAGGLYLVAHPSGTVGQAGRLVDRASLGTFAAFEGTASADGRQSLAGVQRELFDTLARPGFCTLEFEDVDWCETGAIPPDTPYLTRGACVFSIPGGFRCPKPQALAAPPTTPADLFLRYVPNGPERNAIYDAWKDRQGRPEAQESELMRGRGPTGKRAALLCFLILPGFLAALVLFGLIAFRLVGFALLTLVLLLLAPVMILVAALGDSGRRAVAGWGRWLLGSLLGKLVYAVLLAVVIQAARVVSLVRVDGWWSTWVLLTVLWVTLIFERHRLAGWLSAGLEDGEVRHRAIRALGAAYLGTRALREAGHAGAVPIAAVRRRYDQYRLARSEGVRSAAAAGLSAHAERALGAELERDRTTVAEREHEREELRGIERALGPVEAARLRGEVHPIESHVEAGLRERAQALRARLSAPAGRRAEARVRRAADTEAREGRAHSDQDVEAWIARRRRELSGTGPAAAHGAGPAIPPPERPPAAGGSAGPPPPSPGGPPPPEPAPADLEAAGIGSSDYARAAQADRIEMAREAARAAAEQRLLLSSLPADPNRRARSRGARIALGRRRVHEAHLEAADALRAERKLRRARARIFRAPRR